MPRFGGEPWFVTNITIDPTSLPPKVEAKTNNGSLGQYITLINNDSIPLYIIRENTLGDTYPNSELPDKYIPLYKLVSGVYYIYATKASHGYFGWKLFDDNRPYPLQDDAYIVDGGSRQAYGETRPEDVKLPDPQNIQILAYYNDSPWTIRGRLIYSLNKNFLPDTSTFRDLPNLYILNLSRIPFFLSLIIIVTNIIFILTGKYKKKSLAWKRVSIGSLIFAIIMYIVYFFTGVSGIIFKS